MRALFDSLDPDSHQRSMPADEDQINALADLALTVQGYEEFAVHDLEQPRFLYYASYRHRGNLARIYLTRGFNEKLPDVAVEVGRHYPGEFASSPQIAVADKYLLMVPPYSSSYQCVEIEQQHRLYEDGKYSDLPVRFGNTAEQFALSSRDRQRQLQAVEALWDLQTFTVGQCVEAAALVRAFDPVQARAYSRKVE